jgi:hypothetical protein
MANVLVFSTWQLTKPPHYETDLEIVQDHLEKGDRVSFIGCRGELPACDTNPRHDRPRCLYCCGRRERGLGLLPDRPELLPILALTEADRAELAGLETSYDDIETLRGLEVEEFELGTAVLSTVFSRLRDHKPDLREHAALIRNLLLASLAVYRSIQNHLRSGHIDTVYVFNVRFAITRAVFRACRSMGVDCLTHDRGHDIRHYTVRKNVMLHDIDHVKSTILENWQAGDPAEREEKAVRWFEDRAGGKVQAWRSFVKDQRTDLLPADWNDERRNVSIFISSEDEFAAIGEHWKNPLYEDQMIGLRRIVDSVKGMDGFHLYLRVHPNLAGLDNEQTREIASLRFDRLTVIPADSPISTYLLMRRSEKIITFGSTVGIEATFWGIPSILAGKCFYRSLGGTHNPMSHEELMRMLADPDLPPGPRESALMFGYFKNTFGRPFKRYEAEGVFSGRYRGRRVRPALSTWASIGALMVLPPLRGFLSRRSLSRCVARMTRAGPNRAREQS